MRFKKSLVCVLVVLWWYTSNIGVILLNKCLLSFYGFRFPVFLTTCHMLSCSAFTQIAESLGLLITRPISSLRQMLKVVVLSVVFCGSVVLGNVSLKYIPVSFNQAIGATTPLFTAVLSFVLLGTVEPTRKYATLVPVVLGMVISSEFEPSFNFLGFAAATMAAGGRALKTVLQAAILDGAERLDSVSLLRAMSPIALLLLIPASLILESGALSSALDLARSTRGFLPILLLNVAAAFCVNLSNFLVTSFTSPLTTQVLGNLKGIVAAGVSLLLFRNPVSLTGLTGFAITTGGCLLYSRAKDAKPAKPGPRRKSLEVGMGLDMRIGRRHNTIAHLPAFAARNDTVHVIAV